jgi:polyhydroxyalkanoate synthesis regulator phasin
MSPQPRKPAAADDLSARVRERLLSSVTLTTDRLQDAVDDAVRRGRMTRKDAEELLATLLTAGRSQTEQLLADLETVLGGRSAVRRVAERARRTVAVRGGAGGGRRASSSASFPIAGYDDLTAAEITRRLRELTPAQLRKVRDRERRGAARKSVLGAVEKRLAAAS